MRVNIASHINFRIADPVLNQFQQVNKLNGHTARVGALAWNSDILSSGSRDRLIMQRDTRTPPQTCERRLEGHRQEVCGLKWSPGELAITLNLVKNVKTIVFLRQSISG